MVDISVCVITLWRESLYDTLEKIFSQDINSSYEVIIILQWFIDRDKITSMNSKGIPVHIYTFEHWLWFGFYRNRAISYSSGNILAWIDDDECPQNNDWLFHITNPIFKWLYLVTTSGCNIPLWQGYIKDCISLLGYPGGWALWFQKLWSVSASWNTSHLCSGNFAVKRFLLLDTPFSDKALYWGEDNALARNLLKKNINIFYVPEATVIHWSRNLLKFLQWTLLRKKSIKAAVEYDFYEEKIYTKVITFIKNIAKLDRYIFWKLFIIFSSIIYLLCFHFRGLLTKNFFKKLMFSFNNHKYTENIVMLGDSLTYRCNWWRLLKSPQFINQGLDSDTVWGFIKRLSYILWLAPKLCFITGWVNDIKLGVDNGIIIHNLTQIIDTLKSNNIIPVLTKVFFVSKKFPNADIINKIIRELNFEIELLSLKQDIYLIDINPFISDNGYLSPSYCKSDGIHLNKKAYRLWAKQITEVINKIVL